MKYNSGKERTNLKEAKAVQKSTPAICGSERGPDWRGVAYAVVLTA